MRLWFCVLMLAATASMLVVASGCGPGTRVQPVSYEQRSDRQPNGGEQAAAQAYHGGSEDAEGSQAVDENPRIGFMM